MNATRPVERPHTYGEIQSWGDDTRWELIDGEAYAMAGPSWAHQRVVTRLLLQLVPYFDARGCEVLPAPLDVRLPRGDETDDEVQTVVQPDIIVVCDTSKLDQRGCRGAPDLVVEVLSPSTAGRDQLTKRAVYERNGVHHYWLVHPIDRIVTIYRRQSNGSYSAPELMEARGTTLMAGHEGFEIDWEQVFASVPAAE